MRVDVYWNVRSKLYSVRPLEGVVVKTAKLVRLTTSAEGKPRVYVKEPLSFHFIS